jgi:hypothetical protein
MRENSATAHPPVQHHPYPDVMPPAGSEFVDTWDSGGDGIRVILGVTHHVTDSDVTLSTSCLQHLDGRIDDGSTGDEAPSIYLNGAPANLNSDQARELAALLLELAQQIDGWVAR